MLGIYGTALGAVGTVAASGFRVNSFEFETMYNPPNYAWGVEVIGVVDPDKPGDPKGRTELSSLDATALSSLDPSVVRVLRAAANAGGTNSDEPHPATTFDTEPTQLRDQFAALGWVDGFADGVIRAFTVLPTGADGPPPITVEASLSDRITTIGKPATVVLTARNQSDRPAAVFAGPRPPFGAIIFLQPVGKVKPDAIPLFAPDDPLRHLPPRGLATITPGSRDRYDPGASTTRQYQLRASEETVQSGRYKATGSFEFGTLVPWRARADTVSIPSTLSGEQWSVNWSATVEIAKL